MPRWEAVGGADKGGILVRDGQDLVSPQLNERLATGAVVEELQLHGERLRYGLLTGAGPKEGWVSIRLGVKELLRRQDSPRREQVKAPSPFEGGARLPKQLQEKAET